MKLPQATEHQLQASMVEWAAYQPWLKVFAIPNGAKLPFKKNAKGKRVAPQATKLKKEGLTPGVADLAIMYPGGHIVFVEVKRPKEKQLPSQIEFQKVCTEWNFPYEIAHSLDEFMAIAQRHRHFFFLLTCSANAS